MKQIFTLSLVALAFGTTSAFASAETIEGDRWKTFQFDFACKFWDHDAQATDRDWNDPEKCFAAAKIIKTVKVNRHGNPLKEAEELEEAMNGNRNLLAVLCDKELKYANGANVTRTHNHDYKRIEGLWTNSPAIVVNKDVFKPYGPEHTRAKLDLKKHDLWGACKVRRSPLHRVE